jgi:hypothetical protein
MDEVSPGSASDREPLLAVPFKPSDVVDAVDTLDSRLRAVEEALRRLNTEEEEE